MTQEEALFFVTIESIRQRKIATKTTSNINTVTYEKNPRFSSLKINVKSNIPSGETWWKSTIKSFSPNMMLPCDITTCFHKSTIQLKYMTEAVVRRYSVKKVFLEKNCACNFIKKETLAQVFSCEFCKISKNTFLTEPLWWLLLI